MKSRKNNNEFLKMQKKKNGVLNYPKLQKSMVWNDLKNKKQ